MNCTRKQLPKTFNVQHEKSQEIAKKNEQNLLKLNYLTKKTKYTEMVVKLSKKADIFGKLGAAATRPTKK